MKKRATARKTASRPKTVTPDLLVILEEFVRDVDAVGVRYLVANDLNDLADTAWPDIVITYRKAVRAIRRMLKKRL